MLDGKTTVCHWSHRDVRVSFNVIGLWYRLVELSSAKTTWLKRRDWLWKQSTVSSELKERTIRLLSVPWDSRVEVPYADTSTLELSDLIWKEWLSDLHIE